jgi:hypothetical protein
MNEQTRIRKDIEAHIIAKAWKDPSYKQELLSNSKFVLEKEFNTQFPLEVNVKVLEENPQALYFVLPLCPEISDLSEEQLEAIAGGIGINIDIKGAIDDVTEAVGDAYNTTKDFGANVYRAAKGGC